MIHRWLLILCLTVVAIPSLAAAQSPPSASVSTADEAYVGDTIPFRIEVANAASVQPPDLGSLLGADFTVQFAGVQPQSSSMTIIINGRVQEQKSSSVTLTYSLTPQRAGEYTIPAIELTADGKALRTRPTRIVVNEPTLTQGLGTTVELSRAYVGQAFKLTTVWTIASAVEDAAFNLNLPHGAFDVRALPPTRQGQYAEIGFASAPGEQRSPARASIEQVNVDGENRVRVTAEFLLVPRRAGRFEVGGVRADFRAVVGERPRSFFDAPWTSRNITQRRYALAPAKPIDVIDLPTAGRPADFSGLVGSFELDAECQPRFASVGDPLELKLVLRGTHPLIDPPLIDLTRQRPPASALAEQFRVPRDPVLPQVADNAAIYSAQIRPRTAQITELPPVELSYFDPVSAEYRVARSNRLPLKIAESAAVGLGSLGLLEDEPDKAAEADPAPSERVAGALPDKVDGFYPPLGVSPPSTLAAQPADAPIATIPLIVTTAALPAAAWAVAAAFAARRRIAERNPAAWRRRGSVRRADRLLRRAGNDPTRASAALRQFIADWCNLPPEALTGGEAAAAIQAIDPVLASRVRAQLDAADRARFGPAGASSDTSIAADARTLIREIVRASVHADSSRGVAA